MVTDAKAAVLREFRRARNYYDVSIRDNNEKAYQYYNEQRPGQLDRDVPETFQSIVSADVSNSIEHTVADILPAFTSEAPVAFIPNGPEDEIQAQTETQLVNDIFIQQSNGFINLLTAFKDALLLRIGAIEIQTYEKKQVEYLDAHNVNLDYLTAVMTDAKAKGERLDVVSIDGEMIEDFDEEVISSNFSVTLRRTTTRRELFIDAFAPDELLITPEQEEVDLDLSNFVARERIMTRSELIELGYDRETVEKLPTHPVSQYLRPSKQREHDITDFREGTHESVEPIRTAFCYMRIDEDNDGIAELRRIVIAGNLPEGAVILEDNPVDIQPFAVGVPFLYTHRVYGVSLYDKIKQVQDIKSKVIRQLLTAGERAVRGKIGVVGNQANIEDLKETVFGGIIRLTTPNGVVSLPADVFPADVTALLGIMDKKRRESGGSAIDKANEEILIGGDTAHGLERFMSAMEQLNSLVAKVLAETLVRQVYTKIHHNLRRYFDTDVSGQIEGNWVSSTPTKWPQRYKVRVALGLTMGDRLRQASAFTQLIEDYKILLEKGSIIADEQRFYALQVARAKAYMIPGAHSYYVNPSSKEGQQAAQIRNARLQQQQQAAAQQSKLLQEVEMIRAQSANNVQMLRNQIKALELMLKTKGKDAELQRDYDELKLKLVELNAEYDKEPVPQSLP